MVLDDGTVYFGYWKDGLRDGEGKECNLSGRVLFHGYFMNGERDLDAILKLDIPDSSRSLSSTCECNIDNETETSQKGTKSYRYRARRVGRKTFSYLKQLTTVTRAVVRRLSLTNRMSLSRNTLGLQSVAVN